MEQIKRRRLGADGWQAVLERYAHSGLSGQEFCRREAINPKSFYRWRSMQGKTAEGVAPSPKGRPAADTADGFVDLGTLGASPSRFEVRLDLGGGLTLHVVRG